jgi:hypothetical protein
MVEFDIGGKQFRFDKLPAMQQFHVSRKIAPLLPPLFPIFQQVVKEMAAENTKKAKAPASDLDKLGPLLKPFADALAGMNDETAEYVFGTCLAVVRYKHGDNWIPFWNPAGKIAMVAELNDVGLMIQLVARVIQDALAPFIAGFLTNAGEPEEASRSGHSQEERTTS